jgi:tRNA (guanine37-N1)-methyltransferase
MTDAVIRLLPGVLGNEESTVGESHSRPGFLAHAQYTRPVEFKGWKVPEILLSGHHGHITEWRKQTSPEQSPHESNDVDQEKS